MSPAIRIARSRLISPCSSGSAKLVPLLVGKLLRTFDAWLRLQLEFPLLEAIAARRL
jgi:hypothetical protein